MKFIPHDYQRAAVAFLEANSSAALFLDMGLGKSVITLTAIQNLITRGEIKRTLVIAPLRVAAVTWPEEVRKWDHLSGLTLTAAVGSAAARKRALEAFSDVSVINRENVPWLVREVREKRIRWAWDCLVIDELSSFKNHQSARFKALLAVRKGFRRFIGLTGTPAPNGLIDLWAQFRILDGGERLGTSIGRYRTDFFDPDKRNAYFIYSWKPKPGSEDAIYERIGDITLSMRTRDWLELPALTTVRVEAIMSKSEEAAYRTLRDTAVLRSGEELVTALNAAALSNKLLQMANGAVYDDRKFTVRLHDRKLDVLAELIESANGKPVLIAYQYRHDLMRISGLLRGLGLAYDILDTPAAIRAWNARELAAGLLHPMSAGHGLNLQTGGSTLIWFGLPWSLELYQQTNARLYRQGQRQSVTIFHLLTRGTLDEAVEAALVRKDTTQSALLAAVKAEIRRR